jgi:hypothetical protein
LLLRQGLPLLTEKLADVTWAWLESRTAAAFMGRLTKLDAGVVLTDLITLLVGEKHVRGKTTLGRVRIYHQSASNFK